MIDPQFWSNKEFFLKLLGGVKQLFPTKSERYCMQVCRNVRLFYIGLWGCADDFGKFLYDLNKIIGETAPFDTDLPKTYFKMMLKVLEISKRIYVYEHESVTYGVILNFLEHQTISHPTPSKLPNPNFENFSRFIQEHFPNDSEKTLLQEKLTKKLTKKEEVEVKREIEEPKRTFLSPSQSQNQNPTPPPKPKYEPGPQFCPACKKPMADEGDKVFCTECGIRKSKREVKHG